LHISLGANVINVGRIMGKLNIASWALLVGAMGQLAFYAPLFPFLPPWVVWVPLVPPWLAIYTISFCRQPPCGPRTFRYALVIAMCWYAAATLLAESLHLLVHSASWGQFSFTAARLLMYLAALSFIEFVRFCAALRRYKTENQL
jgi:hypothetical protein